MIGKRWIAFCTASSTLPGSIGRRSPRRCPRRRRGSADLLHLFPEIEAAGDVGRQRHGSGYRGEGLGEEDVPAARVYGQIHAREAAAARGRGPRGVDHERRRDRPGPWSSRRLRASRQLDRLDADALDDFHPELARAPGEAGRDLGGAGEAVAGPHTAPIRSSTRSAGTSLRASSGVMTRTSAPSPVCSAMRGSNARELSLLGKEEEVADLLVAGIRRTRLRSARRPGLLRARSGSRSRLETARGCRPRPCSSSPSRPFRARRRPRREASPARDCRRCCSPPRRRRSPPCSPFSAGPWLLVPAVVRRG